MKEADQFKKLMESFTEDEEAGQVDYNFEFKDRGGVL